MAAMKDDDSKASEPTGFAGFESLVSNIESDLKKDSTTQPIPEHSSSVNDEGKVSAAAASEQSPPTSSSQKAPDAEQPTSFRFGVPLVVLGVIVVVSIFVGRSDRPVPNPPPVQIASPVPAPTIDPEILGTIEEMPPAGDGLLLSGPQIRWCVYERARIDAMEEFVSTDSGIEVTTFNTYVTQYNQRCSHFKYRPGSLEAIQTELNKEGRRLQAEGAERTLSLRTNAGKSKDAEPPFIPQAQPELTNTSSKKGITLPDQRQDSASRSVPPPETAPSAETLEQQAIEKAGELFAAKEYNKALSVLSLYRERPNAKAMIDKIKEEQFRLLKEGTEISVTSKPF